MSDYLEETTLDGVFNDGTVPTVLLPYVGLALNTAFTDSSYASEASGGGYTRVAVWVVAYGMWEVSESSGVWTAKNKQAIPFPVATADYANDIVGWGIFDAPSAGNLLFHGTTTSKTVLETDMPTIDAEALVIELQ